MIWTILFPAMWVWWQWRKYRLSQVAIAWRVCAAYFTETPPAWRVVAGRSFLGIVIGFYLGLLFAVVLGKMLMHFSYIECLMNPWSCLFAFRPEN